MDLKSNQVIFQSKKWLISSDDKPSILENSMNSKIVVKHLQPYNINTSSHFEFNDWKEMPFTLKKIQQRLK